MKRLSGTAKIPHSWGVFIPHSWGITTPHEWGINGLHTPRALRGCLKDIPMGEDGKSKEEMEKGYALIEHLSGILKGIPMEAFADDERAQYILSK